MYLFNKGLPSIFETLERVTREFEDFNSNHSLSTSSNSPRINLYRGGDGLILTAKIAGVNPEKLDISVVGQTITIKGKYENSFDEKSSWHRKEMKDGNFTRTLELPFKVETDKVEAEFDSGILKIVLPQADSDKPKKIAIKTVK